MLIIGEAGVMPAFFMRTSRLEREGAQAPLGVPPICLRGMRAACTSTRAFYLLKGSVLKSGLVESLEGPDTSQELVPSYSRGLP